jgi:hypothetical protein
MPPMKERDNLEHDQKRRCATRSILTRPKDRVDCTVSRLSGFQQPESPSIAEQRYTYPFTEFQVLNLVLSWRADRTFCSRARDAFPCSSRSIER